MEKKIIYTEPITTVCAVESAGFIAASMVQVVLQVEVDELLNCEPEHVYFDVDE